MGYTCLMDENAISFEVRRAAYTVHTALAPGLLEAVYEFALGYELEQVGLKVERQVALPFISSGQLINCNVDSLKEHMHRIVNGL